jgi:DNA-binding transcriptional ArsR family regulator
MLNKNEIIKKQKLLNETDERMANTFKALSDVNRYRIFRILAKQPQLTVSNIAKILKISVPLASQHVKVLTNAKILQKERVGKKIFPKIKHSNPFVKTVIKTIPYCTRGDYFD